MNDNYFQQKQTQFTTFKTSLINLKNTLHNLGHAKNRLEQTTIDAQNAMQDLTVNLKIMQTKNQPHLQRMTETMTHLQQTLHKK
ncbi:hypothetical protein H9L19_07100 [Weissella diestrammenae]|uniref:Uncharacterized protein n=1 Tax=Weissella diestrammenae TaxID=1162633 RepID=A0A7G9T4V5_9LACO|nr:hypothetical protein [Weissella diestrammenae]MCM0582845.1 hypothetical protein [Weissella diestrammenae]QNN75130.1 hypothetical protein H9L19_07100 [Weissella diestrammenae]